MPAPLLTTEEYLRTPETLLPQELVWGIVRDAAPPAPGHQWCVGRLFLALSEHLERNQSGQVWLSPVDVVLDHERHLVVQPDLIVISNERRHIVTDRVRGAPDLVVEILSPEPRIGPIQERLDWFARYGVRECWLVHQFARRVEAIEFADRRVASRRSFDADAPIRSTVLPRFDASLETILGPQNP